MSAGLYFHTVRHLRPIQVLGRAWVRAHRPRPDMSPAPPVRRPSGPWRMPARRAPIMVGPDTVRLLNVTRTISSRLAWSDVSSPALWLYHLHYFDDLHAHGAALRRAWHGPLVSRWIAENPPGQAPGWDPYPLSLRIVSWIKWCLSGAHPPPTLNDSLAAQARSLRGRLEYHLLGNHLLVNAKALLFAGLYFRGPEADAWAAKGAGVLTAQLREQILADGGHFERSPMYHALVLEDGLDVLNLLRRYDCGGALVELRANLMERLPAMRRWLEVMCHPDGEIALFNDAAAGIAPTRHELDLYAQRLGLGTAPTVGPGLEHLPDTGYVRLQQGDAVVWMDVGEVGPDYIPGHAHADTLSIEMSVAGARIVVNGGTSRYGTGPWRLAERSTAAHSTVEVDGQSSSEVWSGFRVARRARPMGLQVREGPSGLHVECAHDGYRRLPGRVTHHRAISLTPERLDIRDRLEGRPSRATARFHLHPEARVSLSEEGQLARLETPARAIHWRIRGAVARVEPASWHPEFGASQPSACLTMAVSRREIHNQLCWAAHA